MPKLWVETIDSHRRAVHEAILDTTAALAAAHGPLAVTMSQIAEETGIGRPRRLLQMCPPAVGATLTAGHAPQFPRPLPHPADTRDQDGRGRLEAVLEASALNRHEHHGTDIAAFLHHGEHMARAEQHLR